MHHSISTKGKVFLDDCGRERIFNGVNIVDKSAVYLKEKEFLKTWNDETLQSLKALGFNVIRLGFTWAEIEPQMGVYNEEYLRVIARQISLCEKFGIYFYLDCHQDLYTSAKGFGDGAPEWAVLNDDAFWARPAMIWAEGYFYGKGVMAAFQNFWENAPVGGVGLQDRFAAMWQMLAKRFASSPYFLGFDFFNEPYPGKSGEQIFRTIVETSVALTARDAGLPVPKFSLENHFKTGTNAEFFSMVKKVGRYFLRPKFRKAFIKRFESIEGFHEMVLKALPYVEAFDREFYSPFVAKMTKAVREVTDRGIILMENSYFSNLGIPYSAEKPTGETQVAFAPHGYDIWVDSSLYNYANNARVYSIFREHKRSQERLQVPVIVGEFGGTSPGTQWLSHIDYLTAYFNKNKWSSTYWVYTKKMLKAQQKLHFSRPYPQAVCGKILEFSHDREKDVFSLRYLCKRDYEGTQTEIFLYKKPKEIVCSSVYSVRNLSEDSALLMVQPQMGEHEVKVYF